MDFSTLFRMQGELDKHIEEKHSLQGESLLDRKLMAFHIELAELANETRCFKFWSEKGPSPFSVILEEYVDGIHFLLSVGLEFGYDDEKVYNLPPVEEVDNITLVQSFYDVMDAVTELRKKGDRASYRNLFETYLLLGSRLQFTEEDIVKAYFEKNEVNFQRQKEGY